MIDQGARWALIETCLHPGRVGVRQHNGLRRQCSHHGRVQPKRSMFTLIWNNHTLDPQPTEMACRIVRAKGGFPSSQRPRELLIGWLGVVA